MTHQQPPRKFIPVAFVFVLALAGCVIGAAILGGIPR